MVTVAKQQNSLRSPAKIEKEKKMKITVKKIALVLCMAVFASMMLVGCGGSGDSSSADAITGTWKQTDEVNGNWIWKFDGGKCHLTGETTGFESDGTYVLDEANKKVTVTIEGWTDPVEYTYTLNGSNLDLDSTYSSYKLVKQ